jgi:biopolymer transport protein ExbB
MVVAIIALAFFRIFVSLQAQQVDYFAEVGSELELIYREIWYEPGMSSVICPYLSSNGNNKQLPQLKTKDDSLRPDQEGSN